MRPFPRDQACFDQLQSLQPVEAVRAWLTGSFGFGDEPALIKPS